MTATCTKPDCTRPADAKSTKGYCTECKRAARAAFSDKIGQDKAEREARYAEFEKLYLRATKTAEAAASAKIPTPIVVRQHANPLDDRSPVKQEWDVPSGVCGFGWVSVHPGNSSFARWLVAKKGWQSGGYGSGGVGLWVTVGGQSVEIKEAYADAFAGVLKDAGYQAFGHSRMD